MYAVWKIDTNAVQCQSVPVFTGLYIIFVISIESFFCDGLFLSSFLFPLTRNGNDFSWWWARTLPLGHTWSSSVTTLRLWGMSWWSGCPACEKTTTSRTNLHISVWDASPYLDPAEFPVGPWAPPPASAASFWLFSVEDSILVVVLPAGKMKSYTKKPPCFCFVLSSLWRIFLGRFLTCCKGSFFLLSSGPTVVSIWSSSLES